MIAQKKLKMTGTLTLVYFTTSVRKCGPKSKISMTFRTKCVMIDEQKNEFWDLTFAAFLLTKRVRKCSSSLLEQLITRALVWI